MDELRVNIEALDARRAVLLAELRRLENVERFERLRENALPRKGVANAGRAVI
ncbi:MAG: hypothetical protein Tsb0010_18140 [Parvularculaceae bacterium]